MSTGCYCTLPRKARRRFSGLYDEALAPPGINIAQYALLRTGRSADDHREFMVTLTATGHDLLARARPVWDACQARIEARLGPQKVEALGDSLAAL